MQIETNLYTDGKWEKTLNSSLDSANTLITIFGGTDFEKNEVGFKEVVSHFPNSVIIGCSTAGEIYEEEFHSGSLSIAVAKFEKTKIKLESVKLKDANESFSVGAEIAKRLNAEKLKSIFILSDGINVNGSRLTEGFNNILEKDIVVTGGLAGDDANFEKTWVLVNNEPTSHYVTAVGFYGDDIHVGHGSQGGWNKFGVDRKVTSSDTNILYTLDDQPALEIYKTYLGEQAKDLPSSGLLFPLLIKDDSDETKVRTILAVDEEKQSITFAGDIPQGSKVAFMRANFDNLINGAEEAATKINMEHDHTKVALNIAISCVGRHLVLKQRTEDEIEAVKDAFCDNVSQVGFYSYGEISPLTSGKCDLHNQTMTLTFLWES